VRREFAAVETVLLIRAMAQFAEERPGAALLRAISSR
jgi:hypothetical protein